MDDNYEKILWEGYGLHFLGGNRIRTGYLCKTEQGIFEVRKSIAPLKQILFEHDIREHLAQQGFYVSQFLCFSGTKFRFNCKNLNSFFLSNLNQLKC